MFCGSKDNDPQFLLIKDHQMLPKALQVDNANVDHVFVSIMSLLKSLHANINIYFKICVNVSSDNKIKIICNNVSMSISL